ncbi:hypothetical protein [Sphingobacterium sp. MYb382]|uniref:hypothetical protein n=1 Tax=Sphingobacterium sp. MYb382 TaxID=2745278 RepID=UPI0030A5289B
MRGKYNLKPIKQNDELLKGVFKQYFVEFLRFIYPNAAIIFDFSHAIEFLDKELLKINPNRERSKGRREADLLAKVRRCNGLDEYILVHTEIEGGSHKDFAFRLLQYHYRLLDYHQKPVETIAFFTGGRQQARPKKYQYEVIDTKLSFYYRSYHIFDNSELELLAMDNIFALIVLSCQKALLEGKVADDVLGENRLTIAKALLKRGYPHEDVKSFLVFLKNFIYIENKEVDVFFDNQISELTGGSISMDVIEIVKKQAVERALKKGRQEGIKEGRQEGVKEGVKEGRQEGIKEGRQEGELDKAIVIARKMIQEGFSLDDIAKLTDLSPDELQKLGRD